MRNNQYFIKTHRSNKKSLWNKNYFELNGMKLWYVKTCTIQIKALRWKNYNLKNIYEQRKEAENHIRKLPNLQN